MVVQILLFHAEGTRGLYKVVETRDVGCQSTRLLYRHNSNENDGDLWR